MAETSISGPESARTPAEWLQEVKRLESERELFRAYDMARRALQIFPADAALKHRAVLCLASTGATAGAAEAFHQLGLDRIAAARPADLPPMLLLDIAALHARLLKDTALEAGPGAQRTMLAAAAAAYDEVYQAALGAEIPEAYYPGINAATLYCLAGEQDRGLARAHEIINQLSLWSAAGKGYYELATELEAHLLIDDVSGARSLARLLTGFIRRSAQPDYRALASTIRQLRLISKAGQIDPGTLAALAPPYVVHYLGHIVAPPGLPGRFPASEEDAVRRQIAARLDRIDPGFAYGSLAAGADILFAEALLERGARLHVVLPFAVEAFIDISVRPSGENWVERFRHCYDRAATKRFVTAGGYFGDDGLFRYCSELAMGLALLQAQQLAAPVEQIAVWDGVPPAAPAGTAVDVALWQRHAAPQTIIRTGGHPDTAVPQPAQASAVPGAHSNKITERRPRAILVGEFAGFSELPDAALPRFVETVLAAAAGVVDGFSSSVRLATSTGGEFSLVFDEAGQAADCALALQDAVGRIDLLAAGLPQDVALRLRGHFGPLRSTRDPILGHDNFFGPDRDRLGQIKPAIPDKLVYVTEAFAAMLALHHPEAFVCHAVGSAEPFADQPGYRMFLVARKA